MESKAPLIYGTAGMMLRSKLGIYAPLYPRYPQPHGGSGYKWLLHYFFNYKSWSESELFTGDTLERQSFTIALTREVNAILGTFSRGDKRVWKCIPVPNSLGGGGVATLINISVSNGDLICHTIIIPAAPNQGDKVICWYTGFIPQTFV